jgi:tetratricopeptide (TPR) repeat protein
MGTASPPTSHLKIQLLGLEPHASLNGQSIPLEKRSWELLILMLLGPPMSLREMRKLFESREEDPKKVYKAKSALLRSFRESGAGEWLIEGRGIIQLAATPWIDCRAIPEDEEGAFDYCVDRGDLLRGFTNIELVREERERYHDRLQKITSLLIAQQTTDSAVDNLLLQAGKVLPRDRVQALRWEQRASIEVPTDQDVEAILQGIEAHVKSGETEPADAARLEKVVRELEQAAQHWRPTVHGQVERAATLVHVFESGLLDLDDIYVKVANTCYLGHDLPRAVEFIRPWLGTGKASANAFCTAALYNLRLGYIVAARGCFDHAYNYAPSADFQLTVSEKRDIQLRALQGAKEHFTDAWRSAINNPAYHDMSPGSRASVWCNLASTVGTPQKALELTQKGREIDRETENPHYEFGLLRYARGAGDKRLAGEYEGQVKELMSVPRPPGFWLSYLSLQADQLTTQPSPTKRDLGEADTLWNSLYHDARLASDVPEMCRVLLRRADMAKRLRKYGRAYEYATTAYFLSGERLQNRLRYAESAEQQLRKLHSMVKSKARGSSGAMGLAIAREVSRPLPLLAPQTAPYVR